MDSNIYYCNSLIISGLDRSSLYYNAYDEFKVIIEMKSCDYYSCKAPFKVTLPNGIRWADDLDLSKLKDGLVEITIKNNTARFNVW